MDGLVSATAARVRDAVCKHVAEMRSAPTISDLAFADLVEVVRLCAKMPEGAVGLMLVPSMMMTDITDRPFAECLSRLIERRLFHGSFVRVLSHVQYNRLMAALAECWPLVCNLDPRTVYLVDSFRACEDLVRSY